MTAPLTDDEVAALLTGENEIACWHAAMSPSQVDHEWRDDVLEFLRTIAEERERVNEAERRFYDAVSLGADERVSAHEERDAAIARAEKAEKECAAMRDSVWPEWMKKRKEWREFALAKVSANNVIAQMAALPPILLPKIGDKMPGTCSVCGGETVFVVENVMQDEILVECSQCKEREVTK